MSIGPHEGGRHVDVVRTDAVQVKTDYCLEVEMGLIDDAGTDLDFLIQGTFH